MKKVSLMIVAIIVVCILSTAIFTACSGTGGGPSGPTGPKQVPIYQGMEISGSMPSFAASAMAAGDHQEDNNKDGHKHGPGCTHGNGEDREEDLDEDDPFEEDVPTMEEVAESTLQVVGAEKDIYYADQNETIYITIKIDNPDSFEILSFTLNGQKYSNYMFEDGSDLEHLILKLNVGNAEGIVDYTIDAIKYVDGTEIKDVRMEGDKTVKAGVRRDNLLVTTVTNEDATMTSISFDVSITDTTALIEKSGGYAKAVLYDGVNFVSQDIVIGETQAVQFENLTPNTVYQYGVVALYDDLSGVGPDLNVLYKNAVYTEAIVLFKDLVVEQERFQWDYLWHETITDGTITALELFKDGQKIQDLDHTAKEVTGLLTSNAYTIIATYKNLDGADETIYMDFITLAKEAPVVTIEGAGLTQTSVGFDIVITDTDAVGEITSIALLHGEDEPVLAGSIETRAFENLLSNNEYTIVVTYTYDLNDGVGEQTVVAEYTFTTLAKAVPTVEITNVQSTQTSISFELNVTDTDNVGAISKIELLHGDDDPIVSENTARSFDNLLSNNDYIVKVTYTYNLNDGVGEQQIVKTADITTKAKAVPTVEIANAQSTQTQVSFELNVIDTDNVGAITKIELLHGNDEPILATDLTARTFENLLSNNDYTVKVTYTYNLNDGVGEQQIVKTADIKTKAKAVPMVEITNVQSTQTEISFGLNITDTDNVGAITKIELLHGEDAPIVAETSDIRAFEKLLSNNEYTIVVTYTYDLNDGVGEQTVVAEYAFTTLAKAVPTVEITNVQSTQTEISFGLNITDTDNVGTISKIELLHGEDAPIVASDLTSHSFENLLSNNDYTIQVTYVYDLNDGVGEQQIVKTTSITTKAKAVPTVEIANAQSTQTEISFGLNITDTDNVGAISKIELLHGNDEPILATDLTARTFENLLSNNDYTVKVTYTYNLNDGVGEQQIVKTADIKSKAKAVPTVEIANAQSTQTQVSFELNVTDTDNVGAISKIELLHGDDDPIVSENVARSFENLLSNNEYTIVVTYTYDLNDGVGEQTVVAEYAFTTLAKEMPSATISNLTSTQNTIECDVAYTDVDSVGSVVEIALYRLENKIKSVPFATHVSFDGLESGKEYKVVVEYKYDLNDGKGERTANVDAKYSTLIDSIAVDSLILLNNNVVKLGEELNLRVYFTNSSEIELTGIYVNGQKATVVGGDRIESAIIKFVPQTSGLCRFAIDRVDYVINGIEVNQTIESSVEVEYPIYRDIDITYTPITISKYENTGDGVYLSFDNEDGYTIFKINGSDDFVTVDSGRIFTKDISITSIEYGYADYGHTTQSCDFINDYWSDSIHNVTALKRIYTVEDFFAMTDGYYLLMNDLDLRSVQTKAQIQLTGIFDANGHTIRGLSNVVDTSKYEYFDLFQGGSIYDATFKELYVSVNHTNSADYLYVRPLGNAKLFNCMVKGDVVLSDFVNYGDLNIADDSTTYSLNVTIGTTMSTQNHTASNTLAKNTHIVERDDVFYFDCEVGKAFLSYANRNTADYTVEDGTFFVRSYAFADSETLRSISMPESVKSVGDYSVFANCIIENAVIPIRLLEQLNEEQRKQLVALSLFGDGVTEIGSYAFENCSGLTSITIPDSVTSIGNGAFSGCTGLTSITIPDSVTTIGDDAFRGCTGLTSITIPDSVTSIGDYAFEGCTSLTSITIPDSVTSIGDCAFSDCKKLQNIYITDIAAWCNISGLIFLMSYGSSNRNLYINNELATSVTIPNGVTAIPDYAFDRCSGLTSVTIGDSVTTIGGYAFSDCDSLTSVTIGDSVTTIGYMAFYNCTSLTSVTIGNSVTSIGDWAFRGCSGLTSVTIPDSVTSIGRVAFEDCSKLQNIYITDIAAWCNISGLNYLMEFGASNKNLYINNELATSVTIPDGVTAIPDHAFYHCSGLTSVTIGNSVTTIGTYAFGYCSSLTSVTIGNNLTSIGNEAFYGCSGLTSVTIGNSVTTIGAHAFEYCSKLQNIYITDIAAWCNISGLDYLMWYGSNNKKLYINNEHATSVTIPDGVTAIPGCAFGYCSSLTSVTIPDSVTSIGHEAFYNCSSLTSVTFGENSKLTSIGSQAFYNCTSLTSVTIPDSVTRIGNYAFYGCGRLTSVTIPDSVTTIGDYAFYNCTSLTSVTFGANSQLTTIGSYAFADCYSLTSVTIPDSVTTISAYAFYCCNSLTSVTFGANSQLTTIGECAFYHCSDLTSVTIGDSVTSIGDYAFYGYTSLTDVYYTGTEEQWNAISIGTDNTALINATKHFEYVAE